MTVIQEAIEENKKEFERCRKEFNKATDDISKMEYSATMASVSLFTSRLKSLLPKEREQIEEAYDEGYNNAIWECGTPKRTTATDYYNETFKQ
jgi:hypothetical protein